MGDDMPEGEEEKTMYHMGFAYMNRVNLLLYQCNEASRTDNIEMWYKCLINLHKELEASMTDPEITQQEKEVTSAKKRHEEYIKSYTNWAVSVSSNPRFRAVPFNPPPDSIEFMRRWELSLRKIIKRMGMLMPSAEDPRFSAMM